MRVALCGMEMRKVGRVRWYENFLALMAMVERSAKRTQSNTSALQ